MRKISILATSWLLTSLTLSAATISQEQALQRLTQTFPSTRSHTLADLRYVQTIALSNGEPGLYIFENGSEPGYAILSADDLAAPLLGYSDSGNFNGDSMSPEMKWWLEEYARQIEYAQMTNATPYEKASTRSDKAAITPLISTKWNQSAPYNLQTPEVDGRHCVTGCVATAMAQVMKFWNYPETGKGTGECTVRNKDNSTRTERMLLNEQNFDWNNMLNSYDDNAQEEQTAAVAYLMKACGYATNMKYALNESGTAVLYVASSLVYNFEYNKNLLYCEREYYTASQWIDMIYEELESGRPVVYGGQSNQAGHCFVCDGYDTDGYFHFNWGWGGMSDGYFLLDALNPGSLGIGANGGGYNFDQCAVIGIQPTTGKEYTPIFAQLGNMQGSASGITFTLTAGENGGWYNMDTKAITIDIGIMIEPIGDTTGETIYTELQSKQNFLSRYGFTEIKFTMPSSVKNGTYRLTLCYRLTETEKWIPVRCQPDSFNYIEFTKEGTKFNIQENTKAMPKIEDADILTPLYYGDALKMSVTVTNPTGKEITSYIYPALYSGSSPQMIAEGVTITLAPGETVTKEFTTMFELLNGKTEPTKDTEYKLYFYDPTSQDNNDRYLQCYPEFSKDVTMKIDEFELDLTVEDFVINGYDTYSENGKIFYNVTDAASIPFSLTIINNTEYFAKPVNLVIFPYIGEGNVQNVAFEAFSPFALLTEGESANLSVNVNFVAGEIGNSYFAEPYIDGNLLNDYQIFFTLSEYDGVDSIGREELSVTYDKVSSTLRISEGVNSLKLTAMDATVYDKTSEAISGTVDLSNLPAGIYVVTAIGQNGTSKTLKIAR